MTDIRTIEVPTESLPLWMRQARQRLDWGILLAVAVALIAAWPFILQPGLPRTNDSEHFVFLTSDYTEALREGRLYPRWSPHALNGYGAPIPNFYPPAAPYTAAVINLLLVDDTVLAVRITFVLALCLAGTMTHAFVTRQAGARAGLLASLLVIFSPYFGLTAPHLIGNLSTVLALGLLATHLWAVDRLFKLNAALDLLVATGAGAAVVLAEPRIGAISYGLCLMLTVHHTVTLPGRRRRVFPVIGALVAGVTLSSFYWLPAYQEQDFVTWRSTGLDIQPLALTLPELIQPTRRVDLANFVPLPQLTLGVPLLVFTAFGMIGMIVARRRSSLQLLMLLSGAGLLAGGINAGEGATWVLGPATICLAIGASATVNIRQRLRPDLKTIAFPVAIVTLLIASLPVWLAPRWPEAFGDVSPAAQIDYEQRGYGIAALPTAVDVPATIPADLAPNRFLAAAYRTGPLDRIAADQISAQMQVSLLRSGTHTDRFQILVTENAVVSILRSYYPGWSAYLDGRRVPLARNPQTGLIDVFLSGTRSNPAAGQLRITFEDTTNRRIAWAISWATAITIIGLTLLRLRGARPAHYLDLTLLTNTDTRLVIVVLAVFIIAIALFATPDSPYSLQARPGSRLDNSFAMESRTNAGLELLSFRIQNTNVKVGETIDILLAWRTSVPLRNNYRVRVQLRDVNQGFRWQETAQRQPGWYPTMRWTLGGGRYVGDPYQLTVTENVVPGTYRIAVEVIDCTLGCDENNRLIFFDSSAAPVGNTLLLPQDIIVTR
jgi:hypothetical protein